MVEQSITTFTKEGLQYIYTVVLHSKASVPIYSFPFRTLFSNALTKNIFIHFDSTTLTYILDFIIWESVIERTKIWVDQEWNRSFPRQKFERMPQLTQRKEMISSQKVLANGR